MQPSLAQTTPSLSALIQRGRRCGEEDRNRFLFRIERKRVGDGIAPKLAAKGANLRRGRAIGDTSDVDVEGAQSDVGVACGRRDEGL